MKPGRRSHMQFKTESEASQLLHIIPKQHCLILAELSCMNSMQTLLQANNICTTKFDDISAQIHVVDVNALKKKSKNLIKDSTNN